QLQQLQLFDHAQLVLSPLDAADQGLEPRRPPCDVILDGVGGAVLDGDLVDADAGTRRCEFLGPRGGAGGEDHGQDPREAERGQHQKPPLVVALSPGRRTTRGIVRMPTLTPDASSPCPRSAGLKSQRSRRAKLRGKSDSRTPGLPRSSTRPGWWFAPTRRAETEATGCAGG